MMRLSRTDTEEDGTLMNTGMTVLSHGIICRKPDQLFGYYAWPSVAALPDGTLIAASSGMRMGHICNFGRVTTFESRDQGATWRGPTVVCDTPLDDRDAGLLSLGGNRLLLSWFNLETKYFEAFRSWREKNLTLQERTLCDAMAMPYNDALNQAHAGSFVRISEDGGITWGDAHRVPVTTPHGPALLPDGSLLFLGKEFVQKEGDGPLFAYRSADEGKTWQYAGQPPLPPQTTWSNFFEPHALALPDGRVLAHLRYQHAKGSTAYAPFTIFQTESLDGGVTWS
ncbi:MAG: sialidase family protein, partial [Clostridia bacterium]